MNRLLGLSALLALIVTLAGSPCHASPVPITHGVASGEISPTSVLIWARAADAALLQVQVLGPDDGLHRETAPADAARDYTARVQIRGLRPDTAYRYRVWAHSERLDTAPSTAREGGVRTPPLPSQPARCVLTGAAISPMHNAGSTSANRASARPAGCSTRVSTGRAESAQVRNPSALSASCTAGRAMIRPR